jgi:hydrogenase maturation protein HypF
MMECHRSGRTADQLAAAFHETVAQLLANGVDYIAVKAGLNQVALSGGCFANRILLQRICQILMRNGREVIVHRKVPTGDGGIALGQAVIAAESAAKGNM